MMVIGLTTSDFGVIVGVEERECEIKIINGLQRFVEFTTTCPQSKIQEVANGIVYN